jgi:glycerophosphoryl diester phosphodiesterase
MPPAAAFRGSTRAKTRVAASSIRGVVSHPVFDRLRTARRGGPIAVAHRGDSVHHPENTLEAFAAALALDVAMQEFDVAATRDGVLVCLHDQGLDRTTDAARRLGPGALLAQTDAATVHELDAGAWRGAAHAGARVPTLAEVLALLRPRCVPMIEHKGGDVRTFVDVLRQAGALSDCILQSFDWRFVAGARGAAPELALAVLGPNEVFPRPDAAAIAAAQQCGAGMLHWCDRELGADDVERAHAAGLLVCSYTTDDELGWVGGRALGIDAMCTNDPARMLAWRRAAARPPSSPGA